MSVTFEAHTLFAAMDLIAEMSQTALIEVSEADGIRIECMDGTHRVLIVAEVARSETTGLLVAFKTCVSTAKLNAVFRSVNNLRVTDVFDKITMRLDEGALVVCLNGRVRNAQYTIETINACATRTEVPEYEDLLTFATMSDRLYELINNLVRFGGEGGGGVNFLTYDDAGILIETKNASESLLCSHVIKHPDFKQLRKSFDLRMMHTLLKKGAAVASGVKVWMYDDAPMCMQWGRVTAYVAPNLVEEDLCERMNNCLKT